MGEIVLTPFDIIFKAIRKEMKVDKQRILSRSRKREVCEARQMFCMLARNYTVENTVSIGEAIERDHSSVIYSARTMEDLSSMSKRLRITKGYIENDIVHKLKEKQVIPVCAHCNQLIYKEL